MFKYVLHLAIGTLFLVGIGTGAFATKRVALVVGNSNYENVTPLANPKNDANDISQKLKSLGFEVILSQDATLAIFRSSLEAFVHRLSGADIGLLYYAGHGLQVNGDNYLLPVDAALKSDIDLNYETVPLNLIMSKMEQLAKTNILLLDACRNNTLAKNLSVSMGTRSAAIGRGLARVGTGVGTLIAYATEPGNVAIDGGGRNSPYTAALVEHMGEPGENLISSLIRVRNDVIVATGGKQVPWEHSSLTSKIVLQEKKAEYLKPDNSSKIKKKADGFTETADEVITQSLPKDSRNKKQYQAHPDRYSNGRSIAMVRIEMGAVSKNPERNNEVLRKMLEAQSEAIRNNDHPPQLVSVDPSGVLDTKGQIPQFEPNPLENEELVRNIQRELNRLGCKAGSIDGIWGKGSIRAFERYKGDSGPNQNTAELSQALLEQLRSQTGRICLKRRKSAVRKVSIDASTTKTTRRTCGMCADPDLRTRDKSRLCGGMYKIAKSRGLCI